MEGFSAHDTTDNRLQSYADQPGDASRQKAREELEQAVRGASEVLASATTVFPFTPFPDTITVDREKITVTRRLFYRSAEVITARVEDVLNVTADVGPFMGSLRITTRFFNPGKPYTIKYLWRRDALKLKRILQGYVIAAQKEIDTSALSTEELSKLLDKLGQASPGTEA